MPAGILASLAGAGLSVSVIDGDRIAVSPKNLLTDDLRSFIRDHRKSIVSALRETEVPEPTPDPTAWRKLAKAYHAHHFGCRLCIAAGSDIRRAQSRCEVGLAMWNKYQGMPPSGSPGEPGGPYHGAMLKKCVQTNGQQANEV